MDNLYNLITIIPEIMLLFVPGYVVLRIEELYRNKKRHDNYDTTVYSLLYSAIIGVIYAFIKWIVSKFPIVWNTIPKNDALKTIIYLALAVLLANFLVRFPNWKLGKWIGKQYNENLVPYETVWIKALDNHKTGAWACVYLKNGMMYLGELANYSTNPNLDTREIMLTNCTMGIVKDIKDVECAEDFLLPIRGENEKVNRVLLNAENIIAIEIINNTNESDQTC